MAHFSQASWEKLEGVHPLMVDVCCKVLSYHDCLVVYGRRTLEEQRRLFEEGLSKTMNSRHLVQEDGYAYAVDLAPYPLDWNNTKRFYYFAGIFLTVAKDLLEEDYYIRWGGDWDVDNDLDDQSFMDLVHFELRRKKE